ncbi:hypothetical protein BN946_scf184912.g8 [Trametes cinnabarina]|uniref:N-acetyltransferase domain-containing protein n=1 Tax=Pycnoporus cinnabarinus TaxID=5643 RepID=A0A060SZ15_PYCCI|nr:hypothetical protein BN946_scf184912.g8 [Trametes cinnabarina]
MDCSLSSIDESQAIQSSSAPTDFTKEPVELVTSITDARVNQSDLMSAWDELQPYSVEAAIANWPNMFEFGDNHCIFFAAVLQWVTIEVVDPAPSSLEPFTHSSNPSRRPLTAGGQLHIGVGILPSQRGKGLGRKACELALELAFDLLQVHRVQARIMSSLYCNRARSLFAALGMSHEGSHRRAVTSAAGEWVDVTHMGMLDTDWMVRSRIRTTPKSVWDELLERHQRELEQLLRTEEQAMKLRRTSSMETVHVAPDPADTSSSRSRRSVIFIPSASSPTSSAPTSRASSVAPGSDEDDDAASPPARHTGFDSSGESDYDETETWVRVRNAPGLETPPSPFGASDSVPSSPAQSITSFSSYDTVGTSG